MIRVGNLYLKYIVKSDASQQKWQISIKDMNTQKFLCQNTSLHPDTFGEYEDVKTTIPERIERMVH